ncbi:MAG: hypothetical protein UZ03_NOB001000283, partial [Nitrospira sp. OLB3]
SAGDQRRVRVMLQMKTRDIAELERAAVG